MSAGGASAGTGRSSDALNHCGNPGEREFCFQVWNGSVWATIRRWLGGMYCMTLDGTQSCRINWTDAVLSQTQRWFNINGGPDYLMRSYIHARQDGVWDVFQPPQFSGYWIADVQSGPYDICKDIAYSRFEFLHGSC